MEKPLFVITLSGTLAFLLYKISYPLARKHFQPKELHFYFNRIVVLPDTNTIVTELDSGCYKEYGNSLGNLIASFVGDQSLSAGEVQELRDLLDQLCQDPSDERLPACSQSRLANAAQQTAAQAVSGGTSAGFAVREFPDLEPPPKNLHNMIGECQYECDKLCKPFPSKQYLSTESTAVPKACSAADQRRSEPAVRKPAQCSEAGRGFETTV